MYSRKNCCHLGLQRKTNRSASNCRDPPVEDSVIAAAMDRGNVVTGGVLFLQHRSVLSLLIFSAIAIVPAQGGILPGTPPFSTPAWISQRALHAATGRRARGTRTG